jgi:hypothetical protein
MAPWALEPQTATGGTAKVRGNSYTTYSSWVGLWIGKSRRNQNRPTFFPERFSIVFLDSRHLGADRLYPTSGSVDLAVMHRLLTLNSIVFLLVPAATKKARNISRASGRACPDFWQIFGKQLFEGGCDGRQNSKYPHKYWGFMVGLGGHEPPTSPLSVLRSLVPQLAVILAI